MRPDRLAGAMAAVLSAPAAVAQDAQIKAIDVAVEALRRALNELPRYSFMLDGAGTVRRFNDGCGSWIEWSAAHALFDPVVVDALAARHEAGAAVAPSVLSEVVAECIDWSLPCPSIFERERPLAEATLRRIAHGVMRYVINSAAPFIARIGQTGHSDSGKVRTITAPLSTITTKAEHLLVSPSLATIGYGERDGQSPRVQDINGPLGTIVGAKKHALVAAFLAKHYTGVVGSELPAPLGTVTTQDHHSLVAAQLVGCGGRAGQSRPRDISEPVQTITAKADTCIVTSHLAKLRGTSNSAATDVPLHTISAGGQHHAEVRAFLTAYYGSDQDTPLGEPMHTVTTKPRFGLVTVAGQQYEISDIGMRMLQPRELYRAQGFPDSYVIDRGHDGRVLPKDAQVRMCGNSVCPPLARALVAANYSEIQALREAA